ncbi:MAG: PAS domain S-box protein [Kiritimatiellae bacterium]|nr:PAS domain S-box protein [Kiritimatiellia bacterium]
MNAKKNMSDTLRIDLIPGASNVESAPTQPIEELQKKKKGSLLNHKWKPKSSEPPAVSRSRYQELLQSIYDAAILTNVYGKISDANVRAVEFLQYDRDELCSLQIFNIVSGTDKSLIQTLCEALKNERFTLIQAYCRRKDGTFFPAEIAVNMLKFGQLYLCFFIRDITRRKQIEDRLRTEHEAVHNAAIGIAIADLDAMLEYANPAFSWMVDIENSDDLVGKDLRDFLDAPSTIDTIKSNMEDEESIVRGMIYLLRAGGEKVAVDYCATCSYNDDGDPINLVFSFDEVITDASENTTSNEETLIALQAENEQLREELASYRQDLELQESEQLDKDND